SRAGGILPSTSRAGTRASASAGSRAKGGSAIRREYRTDRPEGRPSFRFRPGFRRAGRRLGAPWQEPARRATIPPMLETVRRMPAGIRLFLFYAFAILAGIGLSLRFVVDQAIGAPISGTGVVVMVLLAYTIFTTTLVLQRKEASRSLAI